jgi:hypothetical protein
MDLLTVFSEHYVASNEALALEEIGALPRLQGFSLVIVDVSGSMEFPVGNCARLTVAAALAAELKARSDSCTVYASAGSDTEKRHQTNPLPYDAYLLLMALRRACLDMGGGGMFLKQAEEYVRHYHVRPDRLVIITDEKQDYEPKFGKQIYMINVLNNTYEECRSLIGC